MVELHDKSRSGVALLWGCCAALAISAMAPAPLYAEASLSASERSRRHALLTRANEAWAAQDYEAALRLYERAQAIKPHPDILYRIGQVRERLGHDKLAADAYQGYLDAVPDSAYADRISTHIGELRQSQRVTPPTLRVATTPPGATILLDGQPLDGVSPYEVVSTPGNHTLAVRLEGFLDQQEDIQLSPGQTLDRAFTLEPLVEPEPEPEPEPQLEFEEPEPQSEPEKHEVEKTYPPRHVDISPPTGWKILGHTLMIPGTFLLVVGSLGLAADGIYWIDLWGPWILGGAAGVGVGSYILFIKDWKPRVKPSRAASSPAYSAPMPSLPTRRATVGGQNFRGFNLKLHF